MTTKTKIKVQSTLNSNNFLVSLISLTFLAIGRMSGSEMPQDASEQLLAAITSKDLTLILSVIVPNIIKPVIKIIKEQRFSWEFLKNKNIQTQAITVLLLGISGYGMAFPESAAANILDAAYGGEWSLITMAIVINFINPIYHFFLDPRDKKEAELETEKK